MKNICKRLLLVKTCSGNWEKLKTVDKGFQFFIKKKTGFFNINIRDQWKCRKCVSLYFFSVISWLVCFGVLYLHTDFFDVVRNKLPDLIKRRSKVQEKNMSCERALDFDQWKTFSENYRSMRVWLWLVYKCTENYCRLQHFFEFIQTQNRYPTSRYKINILNWKLLVTSS